MAVPDGSTIDEIGKLLAAGPPMYTVADAAGRTPLHTVALYGAIGVLRLILASGRVTARDVNAADRRGVTPLMLAASCPEPYGSVACKALMTAGAQVDAVDRSGATPLLWAAGAGNPATVEALLLHGANVNARGGPHADTPLIRATTRGHVDTVISLLRHAHSFGPTALRVDEMDGGGVTAAGWCEQARAGDGWDRVSHPRILRLLAEYRARAASEDSPSGSGAEPRLAGMRGGFLATSSFAQSMALSEGIAAAAAPAPGTSYSYGVPAGR